MPDSLPLNTTQISMIPISGQITIPTVLPKTRDDQTPVQHKSNIARRIDLSSPWFSGKLGSSNRPVARQA